MQNSARLPASACRARTQRLRIRGVRAKTRASTAQSITADHFLFLEWTKSGRLTVRWAERGRLPAHARSECGAGAGEVNVIRGIKHGISWTWKFVDLRRLGPSARWMPRTNATLFGSRTSRPLMNEPTRHPRRARWRPSTNGAPHRGHRSTVARIDGVARARSIVELDPPTGEDEKHNAPTDGRGVAMDRSGQTRGSGITSRCPGGPASRPAGRAACRTRRRSDRGCRRGSGRRPRGGPCRGDGAPSPSSRRAGRRR